jgi:hypothetical protein
VGGALLVDLDPPTEVGGCVAIGEHETLPTGKRDTWADVFSVAANLSGLKKQVPVPSVEQVLGPSPPMPPDLDLEAANPVLTFSRPARAPSLGLPRPSTSLPGPVGAFSPTASTGDTRPTKPIASAAHDVDNMNIDFEKKISSDWWVRLYGRGLESAQKRKRKKSATDSKKRKKRKGHVKKALSSYAYFVKEVCIHALLATVVYITLF